MEKFMGNNKSIQPGFRFYPTDEELLLYYLKRKVLGKSLNSQVISELDVYKFEPWDLPAMACLKTKDRYWFFFCPQSKKYPSGGRVNRTTERGYWKSTGNDSPVKNASKNVGKIKTLIFHLGKAPKGERTNWVMHEYALDDKVLADKGVPHDSYVICKIFEKSGAGPKNGEDYGARFVEEEWDSDIDDNVLERNSGLVLHNMDCGRGSASIISSSVGAPKASSPDTPFTAAAPEVPSPSTAAAAEVPSSSTNAFVGTPYTGAASSLDVPIAIPSFVGVPEASVECGSALPTSKNEVDMLLEHFTENAPDFDDIFSGLGDLADPSVHHIDWGECSNIGFIEMSDLV